MVSQMPPHINDGSQELPGARCGQYIGRGTLTSYPCMLPFDHEGPCAVIEQPQTFRERERWMAARQAEVEREQATVRADHQPSFNLPPGIPVPPTILTSLEFQDPHTRHLADLTRFSEGKLSWVNQAFTAHQCMIALGLFYARCRREYARGADQVVITEDYLDALIPEVAKSMFDQYAVAPQE